MRDCISQLKLFVVIWWEKRTIFWILIWITPLILKYCLLQLSPSISPIILGHSYVFSCVKLYRAGKYWGRKLRFVEKYLLPLPTLCVSECFFVFFHSLDLHMSPLKIKTERKNIIPLSLLKALQFTSNSSSQYYSIC